MADLGENIQKLGFGLMRPPVMGDGGIDLEQVEEMTDRFLAAGFTYFDTAYGYLDGRSEEMVRKVLVERYPRERFLLATKLPAWLGPPTREEARAMFDTSLKRTGAGYFDFYLLHNVGDARTQYFDDYGIWDYLAEKKKQGLIRHLGFSFHDKAEVLDQVLTRHPEMEFVQLQLNYADWESITIESRKCYETARHHGKPIIVMEPVKGGALAKLPPEPARILQEAEPDASQASWALRFAAGLEGVVTVLSGMSSLEQMEENIKTFQNLAPMDERERTVLERARQALVGVPSIPCTDCRYCVKGCPMEIQIPKIMASMNLNLVYGNMEAAKVKYGFSTRTAKASQCVACGACERACPQHISIIRELKRAAETFE